MACYSPMIVQKFYNRDGSESCKFLGKVNNEYIKKCYSKDESVRNDFSSRFILVPCGNCIGCRLDYSATWADRMLVESFDSPAMFLTLTYDDEFIPENSQGYQSISNDQITKFIQDLRNYFRDRKIRYCIASEYGDENLRPHFHCIIYNLDESDLKLNFYKCSDSGDPYFTSDVLSDIWKYGFNVVSIANYHTMAYTARYILKKQKGEAREVYENFDIEPPKFRMSRKPGIGYDWIISHYEELYQNGYVPCSRLLKPSGKIEYNRYFDKIVSDIDPKLFYKAKELRQDKTQQIFEQKLNNSSMNMDRILEFYKFERENFLKKNNFSRKTY